MKKINVLSSSELDGFVIGTVLGDSSLIRPKKTHNTYFKCSHCTTQKELIEFKKAILEQIHPVKVNLKKDSNRESYQLSTNSLVYFNKIYNLFYKKRIKQVNNQVLKKLTPLGLAIWYMDDGQLALQSDPNDRTKILSRRARIWSLSFTYDEHLLIKQYFKEYWNIDIKIYKVLKKGGIKFYIEFNSTNFIKFREIIKPYIIPSMLYKIDLKYDSRYPSLYNKYKMDDLTVKAKQLLTELKI
jgi:recombination protein RecA